MSAQKRIIRIICEAAIMIALAQILSYIKLYRLPNGGSIDIAMLPMIFFAVRYGVSWGLGAGLMYGVIHYIFGFPAAIDWTTIVADYLLAFAVMGAVAGIFKGKSWGMFAGCIAGSLARFAVHLVIGAVVWGKYMPDEFFGMTMTNEWFYSFLYNGSYMLPDMVLITVITAIMYRPLRKYMRGDDLRIGAPVKTA